MDDRAVPPESRDTESLRRMAARIHAGDRPGHVEIEQALEAGFGRLITLEAELGRARKAGLSGPDAKTAESVLREIEALRDVLTELRTLSSPPGPPRIGYGFVLPRQAGTRRRPGSYRAPGSPQHL
jgi:hypothetical protein